MAKKGYLSVRIGNPKNKRIKHRASPKTAKKPKSVVFIDPKDRFLLSGKSIAVRNRERDRKTPNKRVKHKRSMRADHIPSKTTQISKKHKKKRIKHKSESRDVRLFRSGKLSRKAYENYYKNWFSDPKRNRRTKMSKR